MKIALLIGLLALPVGAVEVTDADVAILEGLLNNVRLDQTAPKRSEERFVEITPDAPIGQTFRTGTNVVELFRIPLWQAFWHETWQPDERLVLTLWDSPARQVRLGRCALPYARRMWESAVPGFHLEARVQPDREYYFELTVEVEPLRPAEVPQEWILAGRRPAAAGGDGMLGGIATAGGDYVGGQGYRAGQPADFDLWFETHVRTTADRDALFAKAFGRFDLGRPELATVRAAVEARDWRAATQALIAHFESRADLLEPGWKLVTYNPAFDTREGDLAVDQQVLLEDGHTVDLGPRWNHFTLYPERGGVGLTRSGLRKPLAGAYRNTGHEKYARAFDRMLYYFFTDHPCPVAAGVYDEDGELPAAAWGGLAGGSVWSALSVGARLGHGFYYYAAFVDSLNFTPAVRAIFILTLPEMAEYLERQRGGGNWETQMAMGLFEIGETYPEFRDAPLYVERGFSTLVENALSTVRPDGVLQEPSIGYHQMVMRRYAKIMRLAGQFGLNVPPEMARLTERMYEYVMYATLPDGTLPIWGDANPPMTPQDLAPDAAQFGRQDFLYVGTRGAEGTPPADTSRGFADGGYYFLRSGWGERDHYLGLHAGPNGSHGHNDALSFVLAQFGQQRLIDPGIYTYGTPEARELTKTRSHNTVTVDDADALGATADVWRPGPEADYLAGRSTGLRGVDGVTHHRRLVFVKPRAERPGLWVVFDDVVATPEAAGERTIALRYRFQDGFPVAPSADGSVSTAAASANLTIRVLEPEMHLELTEGIASTAWDNLALVPVAVYSRRAAPPVSMTSVLLPSVGAATPIEAELVRADGQGARGVLVTEPGGGRTLVAVGALAAGDAPVRVTLADGTTFAGDGPYLLLRLP